MEPFNSHSVLSYAVSELGVKHVIVMGHYGCGGVGAAIATPPEGIIDAAGAAIQNWISPIREIYQSSTRYFDAFDQSAVESTFYIDRRLSSYGKEIRALRSSKSPSLRNVSTVPSIDNYLAYVFVA